MTRSLKVLGLALMAIFALGAVAASAASAQQGKLTSSDGKAVTLTAEETGVGQNAWTTFGGRIDCPGTTYTGHLVTTVAQTGSVEHKNAGIGKNLIPNGSTTATLTPHYKETDATGTPNCNGPSGTSVTVDMNGCDYVIHIGATTISPVDTYAVTFDIVCPTGKEITETLFASHTHTTPICVVHIPPVTGLKGADVTDTTNGDLDITGTVEGVRAVKTAQGILCPAEEDKNAKLDIDVTVKAHNSIGNSIGIKISE